MKRLLTHLFCTAWLLFGTVVPGVSQVVLSQQFTGSVSFEGVNRYYYMYLPYHLRPERPLVMVLHGYGQDPYNYLPEMFEVAEREGFAVCLPHGLKSRAGKMGWYVGYPIQENMKKNDDEFICFLSDYLCKEYHLNNSFLTGMSNGGDMCYLVARKHPETFRAIASVAGQTMKWVDDTLPFRGPVPFMEVHGTADQSAKWNGDITGAAGWGAYISVPRAMDLWVRENGCSPEVSLTRLPKKGQHQVVLHTWKGGVPAWNGGPQCEVLLYEIQGGKHSWALADMDTCDLIWDFFRKYLYPSWPPAIDVEVPPGWFIIRR